MSAASAGDVGSPRGVVVITKLDCGKSANHDHVALLTDGRVLATADDGVRAKIDVKVPGTHMPRGTCHAVAFCEVPDGPVRIHVRPVKGAERYYSVTVGTGYRIPWSVSWRFRGYEAYWCGD
jgi:hypothetical protein